MFLCVMLLSTPERAPKAGPATCYYIDYPKNSRKYTKLKKQVAGPALGARSGVRNNITHRNILKKYN